MSETYPPAPVTPRRPRWLIPVIAAALLVLAAGAWGGGYWWTHRGISVSGDVTVTGGARSIGATCETTGGYTDIRAGAQVVIKDGAGTVVATATLGAGTGGGGTCVFPFTVDVPSGSDFYGVELGRRGTVQYSADQLASGVHLTIGS